MVKAVPKSRDGWKVGPTRPPRCPKLPAATGHYRGVTLGSPRTVLLHSIIDNTLFNDVRDVDCRLVGRTHDTGAAQPDADDPGANYLATFGGGERPADAALSLGLRPTRLGSVTISQDTASRIFISISSLMMISLRICATEPSAWLRNYASFSPGPPCPSGRAGF